MSTIITINASDQITNSRADINTNFSNLNTDKIETSVLDTDTALTANSDSKVATQKAVKTYIDTSGGANASTTVRGIVEEATSAEMIAGTAAGATGARLFINPTLVAEMGTDKIVKTKSTGLLDTSIIPTLSVGKGATTFDMATASTGTTVIAHGRGSAPTFVRITAVFSATGISFAEALYSASSQSSLYLYGDTGSGTNESHGATFRITEQTGGYQEGVITVDATNITITWTKTSTPSGTANIIWEAWK